jgi:putative ABC transport system ATP-binding protein
LHESLTALQNVRLGAAVHGSQVSQNWETAATHLLGLLGLGERLHYLPSRLSGGQKQRVAIARALIGNPLIVFADEPTAALDRESAIHVVQILKALARERGTTILMVTHDSKVIDLADRILTMEDGRLIDDRCVSQQR